MPFVYAETEIENSDEDYDPPPPRADQFVYIKAVKFGGAREPVRFSDPSRDTATTDAQSRGFFAGLFGQRQALSEDERRMQLLADRFAAIMLSALREIGGRRVYCRYDGGNDEGFAWLDSVETGDGERLGVDVVVQRLFDIQVKDKLYAADLMENDAQMSDREQLYGLVRYGMPTDWATMLLGSGYGTGEFWMYGAFTVDLVACTITDDRHADPVVENIVIAGRSS
jgi:hypothetical protein